MNTDFVRARIRVYLCSSVVITFHCRPWSGLLIVVVRDVVAPAFQPESATSAGKPELLDFVTAGKASKLCVGGCALRVAPSPRVSPVPVKLTWAFDHDQSFGNFMNRDSVLRADLDADLVSPWHQTRSFQNEQTIPKQIFRCFRLQFS